MVVTIQAGVCESVVRPLNSVVFYDMCPIYGFGVVFLILALQHGLKWSIYNVILKLSSNE